MTWEIVAGIISLVGFVESSLHMPPNSQRYPLRSMHKSRDTEARQIRPKL